MILMLSSVGMASAKGKDGGSGAKGTDKSAPTEEPTPAPTTSTTSTADDGDTSGSTSSGSTAPKRTRSARSGTTTSSTSTTTDAATITLSGCVVSASKDISNIAFYDGTRLLEKDESIGTRSFDLSGYSRIGEVDRVVVKAGTTTRSFSVNCGDAGSGDADDDGDADDGDGDGDDDTAGTHDDADDEDADEAAGDSGATITLSGCLVSSTKDISNIAFFDGTRFLDKDESIDARTFDLRGFAGIDEVTRIVVKSGTVSRTFAVNCDDSTAGNDDADGDTDGDNDDDADDTDGDNDEDGDDDGTTGCPVDMSGLADAIDNAHVSAIGTIATGTFTIPAQCAAVPVSLAVYRSGTTTPWRSITGTFGPGAHALHLPVPDCGFIATLSAGAPALTGPRVLDRTSGGDIDCADDDADDTDGDNDEDADDDADDTDGDNDEDADDDADGDDDTTGDDDTHGAGDDGTVCPITTSGLAAAIRAAFPAPVVRVMEPLAQGAFTMPAGCPDGQVTLASYGLVNDRPVLFQSSTGTFDAGAGSLAVAVPVCSFLVTLATGQASPAAMYGGRLLADAEGGDGDCARSELEGGPSTGGPAIGGRDIEASGEGVMPLPSLSSGGQPGAVLPVQNGSAAGPAAGDEADAVAAGAPAEGVEGADAAPGAPAPSGSLPYTGARSLGLIGLLTMLGALALRAIGKRAEA